MLCRMQSATMQGRASQRQAASGLRSAQGRVHRVATAAPHAGRSRQLTVNARAERGSSEGSFVSGFIVGGVVFGALGFLFAPQLSKALLGDDARLRLPRFMEDELPKDPEATKQDLVDKIAQLNASIDEVASQLRARDGGSGAAVEAEAEAATS